jgi:hypothetical protein
MYTLDVIGAVEFKLTCWDINFLRLPRWDHFEPQRFQALGVIVEYTRLVKVGCELCRLDWMSVRRSRGLNLCAVWQQRILCLRVGIFKAIEERNLLYDLFPV